MRTLERRRSEARARREPLDERRDSSFCMPALRVAAAAREWEGELEDMAGMLLGGEAAPAGAGRVWWMDRFEDVREGGSEFRSGGMTEQVDELGSACG